MLNIREKPSIRPSERPAYNRGIDFPLEWSHYGFWRYDLLIIAVSASSTIDRLRIHKNLTRHASSTVREIVNIWFLSALGALVRGLQRVDLGLVVSDLIRLGFILFLWFLCSLYTSSVAIKHCLCSVSELGSWLFSVQWSSQGHLEPK